ncbi:class I SAM-dependent DNA methyltransferase, partial [bacterium]|nr:class I SAM-dependent DNA methyltransferase [bacterium]
NSGFDAIVGNPPFAGVSTLSESNHEHYTTHLRKTWSETGGKCDLVAFFFRRAFDTLRASGCFGLIATNTISQGDTRASSLIPLVREGATIYAATKRLKWPGEAAVVVSVIHMHRGHYPGEVVLNREVVPKITAFLFTKGGSEMPLPIPTPIQSVTKGVVPYGVGFVVDDGTDGCIPRSTVSEVLSREPKSSPRVRPYMGGEDINNIPSLNPDKQIVYLDDLEAEDAARFPGLFRLIEQYVKPERDALTTQSGAATLKRYWWRYQYSAHELFDRIGQDRLDYVFAVARVSPHLAVGRLTTDIVFNEKLIVFPINDWRAFAVVQSMLHDGWVRLLTSTLEDRLNYSPSDCFETFPFPENFETDASLEAAGKEYYEFRAALMVKNDDGLTKTYNRFHDPGEA